MPYAVIALVSYLIGSIPSGYVAGRIANIDIRKVGSGNIGATNVTRALGKRYGYPVFIADFSKGLGSVLLARFAGEHYFVAHTELLQIVAGVFCVLGNAFPVWLRFRGGKGVATSAGMLFGLTPLAVLVAIVVWVVTFQVTRYVSAASITAAVTLPVTVFVLMHLMKTNSSLILYVSIGLAVVVVLRHRSNLSRLMRGTEERFERRED
jgi:glycerol-3-phosphate acyltransferase PlsY